MHSIAPLRVTLQPSRRLRWLMCAAHGGAGVAVLAAQIPVAVQLALLMVVLVSLVRQWRKGPAVGAFVLHGDGRLEKVGSDDTASFFTVAPYSIVLPFLVVLNLVAEQRRQSYVLLDDSMIKEDFRLLRRWLRWRAVLAKPAGTSPADY